MANNISVGLHKSDKGEFRVGLYTSGIETYMSAGLARNIAIDLMIWADRIDPKPKEDKDE